MKRIHYVQVGKTGLIIIFQLVIWARKEGVIWSPAAGSKMNRLVEIGIHLIQLMSEKSAIIRFDTKFSKEIMDLTKVLE